MATETKKKSRKKSKEKNENKGIIGNIRTYLGEVRNELNKVTWPDREEVIRLTRIVFIVTAIAAIVLGVAGAVLTFIIEYGIDFPVIFIIMFGAIIGGTIYMLNRDNQRASY
jgi:preprotein translocase subunit SecE